MGLAALGADGMCDAEKCFFGITRKNRWGEKKLRALRSLGQ